MKRWRKQRLVGYVGSKTRVDGKFRVTVIGGGLAGVAAATILTERGAAVTVIESEETLGGRAGGSRDSLSDGNAFHMERGFHGFFRQYYNLRALLRRIDPKLSMLTPLGDYPILGADGHVESFTGLPKTAPFNVIELTRRSPHLDLRSLTRVNVKAAMAMLQFDVQHTFEHYDDMSAGDYLDSLRFPDRARAMLFNVFAHSFFNPETQMSAGELLMMFHFFFMGNREGLVFDVVNRPLSVALWDPFANFLEDRGASICFDTRATCIRRTTGGFTVDTESDTHISDAVVLATSVPALQKLLVASPDLAHPQFTQSVESLDVTLPFAVWRLWLDKPTRPGRSPFAGTCEHGILDNISLYHLFQDESREWARAHGGAVVELHAYAVPAHIPEVDIRKQLLTHLHTLYPETQTANIVDERWVYKRDCPAFAPGTWTVRPTVDTAIPGLVLAGDFVRLPIPTALMERSVTSGIMAANRLLESHDVSSEPIESVPTRGLFARMRS